MKEASWTMGIILAAFLAAGIRIALADDLFEIDARRLAAIWETERVSPLNPYMFRHEDMRQQMQRLSSAFPELVRVEQAGSPSRGARYLSSPWTAAPNGS